MPSAPLIPGLQGVRRRVVYVTVYELIAIMVASTDHAIAVFDGSTPVGVVTARSLLRGVQEKPAVHSGAQQA